MMSSKRTSRGATTKASDARGERAGQQLFEELPTVGRQLVHGSVFITPIERAQEVTAVPAVQGQERGRFAHEIGHEANPPRGGEVPAGQPGVAVHHVGGDQGVLEVEDGQVAVGRQDGPARPLGALVDDGFARRRAHAGVLDD
jgi:hypothetical protein